MIGLKPCVLLILNAFDLLMNSSFEFDTTFGEGLVVVACAALQAFVLILAFISLFLMLADTYFFQVGIIAPLLRSFIAVSLVHPVYIVLTTALGIYRAQLFLSGTTPWDLWDNRLYSTLSTLQKLTALMYYHQNLRTVIKLGDPNFRDPDCCVALFSVRHPARAQPSKRRPSGVAFPFS